jgi:hypothetical protein
MENVKEVIRDSYRGFAYVVIDNSANPSGITATEDEGLNTYSVYFAEETNPKLVFPDDLEDKMEWSSIKADNSKLQQQIEVFIDKELDK